MVGGRGSSIDSSWLLENSIMRSHKGRSEVSAFPSWFARFSLLALFNLNATARWDRNHLTK